ncbi:Hpt domain-containing protein [Sulfitobacter sp. JB4-11]|uniref:Hpt domain-containing protein n=1 Tax=Sulfitobacter rhodophyticola TaxID=3238304 RepID=UPI003516EC10
MMNELPGIDRVRGRFLDMLEQRQAAIAGHALAAWDGETLEDINGNLASAQAVLHQISGSAGSLGFPDLGKFARYCELEIIGHLEGPDADLAICPGELIYHLDRFVTDCRTVIAEQQEVA